MSDNRVTNLTLTSGIGQFTTVSARSHYGQPVWEWRGSAPGVGDAGTIKSAWDDPTIIPCDCRVLWTGDGWLILEVPQWDSEITAIHLETGYCNGICLDGDRPIIDRLGQITDAGYVDLDDAIANHAVHVDGTVSLPGDLIGCVLS